jgi:hypothetical protein
VIYATRATGVETINGWLGKKFPDRGSAVCALVDELSGAEKLAEQSAKNGRTPCWFEKFRIQIRSTEWKEENRNRGELFVR